MRKTYNMYQMLVYPVNVGHCKRDYPCGHRERVAALGGTSGASMAPDIFYPNISLDTRRSTFLYCQTLLSDVNTCFEYANLHIDTFYFLSFYYIVFKEIFTLAN
jgi:hypothetical protein